MKSHPRIIRWAAASAIAVLVVATAVSGSPAAEIRFRSTANVAASSVQLKDVAAVTAADAETVSKLENIVLAPAPAAGRQTRLDFAAIRSRLEASGHSAADLKYSGSTSIIVTSSRAPEESPKAPPKRIASRAQLLRAQQVMTEAVRRSAQVQYPEAGAMSVRVVVDPADAPVVLAGAVDGFEVGPIDLQVSNPQTVAVGFQDARGQVSEFRVQCTVAEQPEIPVLTHAVTAGQVLSETDLTWKQIAVSEGVLTRFEDIVNKEAKKTLRADEPIHADEVRGTPLVRSNDIVTGVWRRGGIRITQQFKSRNDGAKGDVVTLVRLTGREQVFARVTDLHEAEIVDGDQQAAAPRVGADGGPAPGRSTPIRRAEFAQSRESGGETSHVGALQKSAGGDQE